MFTIPFLILAVIILITFLVAMRAQQAHKAQEMKLTADELKTFNERFRFKRDRSALPVRFNAICAASDRLRRTSAWSILAVVAGIAFVIFKGPTL